MIVQTGRNHARSGIVFNPRRASLWLPSRNVVIDPISRNHAMIGIVKIGEEKHAMIGIVLSPYRVSAGIPTRNAVPGNRSSAPSR